MSQETVAQFLNAVKADSSLQAALKESKSVDGVIAQASKAGYDLTEGDLIAYGKTQASNDGMSDEELEKVAGGGDFVVATYTVYENSKVMWTAACWC